MRVSNLLLVIACACSHHGGGGTAGDAPSATADAPGDAAVAATCMSSYGSPGTCIDTSACTAMPDRSAVSGCAMTAPIACCIDTPDVADNPPTPVGYKLMMQSQVTPAMTTWAVAILHDPVTYPMFSTTTMTFGALAVLARVEWHPADFQNSAVHRGVTLYTPG